MSSHALETIAKRILPRTVATIQAGPKIFLGSFFWEGFALMAANSFGLPNYSWIFCLLTGIGSAIGIIIGHYSIVFLVDYADHDIVTETHTVVHLAISLGLITGGLWQASVDISYYLLHLNFTEAFFLVGTLGFGYALIALILFREVNALIPRKYRLRVGSTVDNLYHDFLLAIAIGAADSFFVATSSRSEFPGDWLTGFAVESNTNTFVAMCLAGSSSLCGFFIVQTLQNLFLTDTWLDVKKTFPIHTIRDAFLYLFSYPAATTTTTTTTGTNSEVLVDSTSDERQSLTASSKSGTKSFG